MQPGAAAEVGGDTAGGHQRCERLNSVEEACWAVVAPRPRADFVRIDRVAIHGRIIAAMTMWSDVIGRMGEPVADHRR